MFFKRFALSSLLAVFAIGALLARPVRAASLTVTTPTDVVSEVDGVCSLREAVIAANTNTVSGEVEGECPAGSDTETDIITLVGGETYPLALAGLNEDASATGDLDILDNAAVLDVQFVVADAGSATIDAVQIDRVLHLLGASVEITSLSLINGDASLNVLPIGGIVLNQDGLLTMNGGELRGGTALSAGGLYNYGTVEGGGEVTLNGTQVILNEGLDTVGAIMSDGLYVHLTLNGAQVRANTTPGNGGGLGLSGGVTEIYSSTISLNTADGDGGGIIAQMATITITHALIEANEANTGNGGGINLLDAATTEALFLSETSFSENIAGENGGGLFADEAGTLTVSDTDFSLNSAGYQGGGVYAPYLVQTGGLYQGNQAVQGGAAYVITQYEADAVTYQDNSALDGGAVRTQFLIGEDLTFHHNLAEGFGGAVYLSNDYLTLDNSTFSENIAGDDGGAIYQKANDAPRAGNVILGSLFHLNSTGGSGGALWTDNALTIANSTLAENTAAEFGGGVYLTATGLVTTTHTTFAANQADGQQGSGIYNLGKVWMANTLFGSHPFDICYTVSIVDLISLGHNLSEGSDCNLNADGDQPDTPAGLVGAVQDNGGPTWTWALDPTSAAVNAGDTAYCEAGTLVNALDQRGFPRVGLCDIGAYEVVWQVMLPLLRK